MSPHHEPPPRNEHTEADAATKELRSQTDKASHQAMIKIVYDLKGNVVEAPVSAIRKFLPDFQKAILLVEGTTLDSDRCRDMLHELGYDGIQLITNVQVAVEYLDDVLNNLSRPPDAIVLDLTPGFDSGFDVLRKCHAHPKLNRVPILVWTKVADEHTEAFSMYLGAKDFLIKSPDKQVFRATLQRLLAPKLEGKSAGNRA